MKDRSDDPSHHERTLLQRRYISLHVKSDPIDILYMLLADQRNTHYALFPLALKLVGVNVGTLDKRFTQTSI